MKVSTKNNNNFGYEKITIVVDNIPLIQFFTLKLLGQITSKPGYCIMDAKIRGYLPHKYGRFMLFIDNNLLLPGARLHILNNIYRK
jgi:hypothetical protein